MFQNHKIHIVSFTTSVEDFGFSDLELRQLRLNKSAKKFGVDIIHTWNRQRLLKTDFYKAHKKILLFKPPAEVPFFMALS